jgi:hypothetical protein
MSTTDIPAAPNVVELLSRGSRRLEYEPTQQLFHFSVAVFPCLSTHAHLLGKPGDAPLTGDLDGD